MTTPKKFFGARGGRGALLLLAGALTATTLGCASSSADARRLGEPIASPQRIREAAFASMTEDAAVTIYGVESCGPCHQAADYLSRRGVHYVERNIDGDVAAQREMQSKLERAGLHAGAVPVIDVNGTILVGFNPQAVARALTRRL
jgi:glutaredoxin